MRACVCAYWQVLNHPLFTCSSYCTLKHQVLVTSAEQCHAWHPSECDGTQLRLSWEVVIRKPVSGEACSSPVVICRRGLSSQWLFLGLWCITGCLARLEPAFWLGSEYPLTAKLLAYETDLSVFTGQGHVSQNSFVGCNAIVHCQPTVLRNASQIEKVGSCFMNGALLGKTFY